MRMARNFKFLNKNFETFKIQRLKIDSKFFAFSEAIFNFIENWKN